jgi:hypothetical protein
MFRFASCDVASNLPWPEEEYKEEEEEEEEEEKKAY